MGSEQKVGILLSLDLSSFDSIGLDLDFNSSSFGKISLRCTKEEPVNAGRVSPQFKVPAFTDYVTSRELSQELVSEAVNTDEAVAVGVAHMAKAGNPQIGRGNSTVLPQFPDAFDERPVQQHVLEGLPKATPPNSATELLSVTEIAMEAVQVLEVVGISQDLEPFSSMDRPASLASALSSPPLSSPPLPFNILSNIPHASPNPPEPLPAPPFVLPTRSKSNSSASAPNSAKAVNSVPKALEGPSNSFGPTLVWKISTAGTPHYVQHPSTSSHLPGAPITPSVILSNANETSTPTVPVEAPKGKFGGLFRRKSVSAASSKQQQNPASQQHVEMERTPSVASVRSFKESALSEKSKRSASASYGPAIYRRKSVSKDLAKADVAAPANLFIF
ncbi:hypothetical protein BC830DRAFT_1226583 [Chytriomyces sp. MP71]|nr:hypothetical protein BC830DRAFT_1226583 [Chytriomyces sp. MP71]